MGKDAWDAGHAISNTLPCAASQTGSSPVFAISIHAIPPESGFKSSYHLVRTEMGTKWVIVEESKEESSKGSRDNKG